MHQEEAIRERAHPGSFALIMKLDCGIAPHQRGPGRLPAARA